MAKITDLLEGYLDYLEIEKNRSLKTRENYERYITRFIKDTGIKIEKDITAKVVRRFRVELARKETKRGTTLKKRTQNYYIIALRNFLKFLIKNDYDVLSPDKIELPKIPTRQIDVIEQKDLIRLLDAPGSENVKSLRDKAILELLFSTGLRLSELCNLSRYIDFSRDEFTVRGKGNKLRVVFLSEGAKKALNAYLKARTDTLEWLFVSFAKVKKGSKKQPKVLGKITTRAVQRLVNKYAKKAGIAERVTPHKLRHLFATDLLMNGADIRSVQELLGHSNIATTQIYTHVTNKKLREIHKNFHGKNRKES